MQRMVLFYMIKMVGKKYFIFNPKIIYDEKIFEPNIPSGVEQTFLFRQGLRS